MKDIISIAQKILQTESEAIALLADRLDDSFLAAVEALLNCSGKIVFCGIGKSGLVAKKIVATLTSTGTPSYFLHPAEAIHGDLGILSARDCFVSLSNSGETDEILKLLPRVQQLKIPHISLVGNPASSLAQQASIVLDISVSKEGGSLNAVPLASTISAMAMGDALAAVLLQLKAFDEKDFAQFHLGGSLGRKLITVVESLMQKTNLPLCRPLDAMPLVVQEMSSSVFGIVAVVDAQNQILGVITDGDLRRALARQLNDSFFCLQANQIMTKKPKNIAPTASAWEAEECMQEHQITALLVSQNNQLLGIIGKHQIK